MAIRAVLSDEEDELEEEEPQGEDIGGGERHADDDEDEDDEEEGDDEYEKDGFIVDDEEEEEEPESDGERRKKKKKKKRDLERDYTLDEDDYALLEDNLGSVKRPKPGNKFKRLKKAGRERDANEALGFSDEEGDTSRQGGQTAEEKLKWSLFGDDEGVPLEDIPEEEEQHHEDVDMVGEEEDEMADFIVDADDDDGMDGVRRKKLKKKKARPVHGVSSTALQEAQEIFGDVDELIRRRKEDRGASIDPDGWGEKRMEDEFEPFILSEKYMTPDDDRIRDTDVPERIQLMESVTGPPPTDERSLEEESSWIYEQLKEHPLNLSGYSEIINQCNKEDIGSVLTLLHRNKFDIPFITMYRKESCSSLLKEPDSNAPEGEEIGPKLKWHKVLWAVHNLDRKWLLIQKRKTALQAYYSKRFEEETRRIDDETRLSLNKRLFTSILKAIEDAKSEKEMDDVDAKFNLHFPPGEVDVECGQFKRPKRRSFYSACYKAGLWEVTNKFGHSSEKLGEFISYITPTHEDIEEGKETPEEFATNFTCAMFETPQDVLKGARHMAAVEIACEPLVKKAVRIVFQKNAVVSTMPTPEGNSTIDRYHELAYIKWLQDKPFNMFVDAQWMLIQKGEEEKLLQVSIKLPETARIKLLDEASGYYMSEGVNLIANAWNEHRKLILEDAFNNLIFPAMEKEIRSLLISRAKFWLLMEYGKQLWNKVSVAPYKPKDNDSNSRDEYESRIMACCWGPGKPATTIVMLDPAGEMVDVLYAGSINSARGKDVHAEQRKKNINQRVIKFVQENNPNVICVGAANFQSRTLKDELYEVIIDIVEDHPGDGNHDARNFNDSIFGDESLPRLYENSRISSDQLPGQPGIVKRAVALGRYLQNPLAMIATLCGPGKEILSWKLFPLDYFLTPDEKYEMVEQVMVDATNQVCIDINFAASHEWMFAPLQFISGLGPRKASALQRYCVKKGSFSSRKEISMAKNHSPKVYRNAIGFLRVCRSGAASYSSAIMNWLDDTRINPESYELAQDVALEIYAHHKKIETSQIDEDTQELVIEFVRDSSNVIELLNIDEFADDFNSRHGVNKQETLSDIQIELRHGFQDWRTPFREPSQEEEFALFSGETEESLSEGRTVQVTVRAASEKCVFCTFDSGLRGKISAEDFSDDGYEIEKVRVGDVITCKIKHVDKSKMTVHLTSKESGMNREPFPHESEVDPYYKVGEEALLKEQEKVSKQKEMAKKHFKPRMIVHPRFQNLTADEAVERLSDMEVGESIIRPSSKGPLFLFLTIKIYDNVYAHKEIVEGGKDRKDVANLLRLGKTLTIGKDTFEDLDEVIHRYVDPLVTHLKNMITYRKFRRGLKAEVDEQLRAEKAENPMRIAYAFGISYEYPGSFVLSYIRSSNPHHEYITMFPMGFKFRNKDFDDIDRLVAFFQKNINKPPQDSEPSIRTAAAMVPMKSPATGPYSGSPSAWGGSPVGNNWNMDNEQHSTLGLITDNKSGGHPSGLPRPGRGRGRGRGNDFSRDKQEFVNDSDRWGSGSNDDGGMDSFPGAKFQSSPGKETFSGGWSSGEGGMGSFPGAKIQNSPGREMFPGGWGGRGSGGGGSGWTGNGGGTDNDNNWDSRGGRWGGRGMGGRGGRGGEGRGRGRGEGRWGMGGRGRSRGNDSCSSEQDGNGASGWSAGIVNDGGDGSRGRGSFGTGGRSDSRGGGWSGTSAGNNGAGAGTGGNELEGGDNPNSSSKGWTGGRNNSSSEWTGGKNYSSGWGATGGGGSGGDTPVRGGGGDTPGRGGGWSGSGGGGGWSGADTPRGSGKNNGSGWGTTGGGSGGDTPIRGGGGDTPSGGGGWSGADTPRGSGGWSGANTPSRGGGGWSGADTPSRAGGGTPSGGGRGWSGADTPRRGGGGWSDAGTPRRGGAGGGRGGGFGGRGDGDANSGGGSSRGGGWGCSDTPSSRGGGAGGGWGEEGGHKSDAAFGSGGPEVSASEPSGWGASPRVTQPQSQSGGW